MPANQFGRAGLETKGNNMQAGEYAKKIIEFIRSRSYREAENLISEALEIYPTNQFFLKNEVFVLARLNRAREAREKAEKSFESLKHDKYFLQSYFTILEKEKAGSDIESMMERTISINIVNDEEFYIFLAKLAGRVFGNSKTRDVLNRAMSIFEKSDKLKQALDELCQKDGHPSMYKYYKDKFKGGKPDDAIAELERIKVLPKYKDDYDLCLCLAELYKKAKRFDKAIETYQYLLSLKDNEFTRKMLGYTYYKLKDYDNALTYLKDIFLKHPGDHYLDTTIGKIFEKKRDFEGFRILIEEALSLNQDAKNLYGLLKKAKKWRNT